MRTIIFSDVHGEPDIVRAVVAHSAFDASTDRLIFAGDAIEIGRDSMGCLDLLDDLGTLCLVGNHEYGAFSGWPIEGALLDPALVDRVAESMTSGRWRLAIAANGVLITHAGLGRASAVDLGCDREANPERIAEILNTEFERVVTGESRARDGIVGSDGPLWWRPSDYDEPASGMVQVIGHTPPEIIDGPGSAEHWASRGIYLIDPFVRGWRVHGLRLSAPVRYAVIEDGNVRVVTV